MTNPRSPHEVALRPLVHETLESQSVVVTNDLVYRGSRGHDLHFDVYRPAHATDASLPIVLLTTGFSDAGMEKVIGCPAKAMRSYRSWARLIAGTGIAAITYTNHEPTEDVHAILDHLHENAALLRIDVSRIGLWSCSGNVPTALSLLMSRSSALACAALLYGYMLDVDGSTVVSDAARTWRFAHPAAGRQVDDLPAELPLLIVRAGRDTMAGLNESIDRFAARALALNRPLTLVNLPAVSHAFDTVDAGAASTHAIDGVLAFLRFHLIGTLGLKEAAK